MTPERAIELLTIIRNYTAVTLHSWQDDEKEAFNMALDFLLRYDDLISRTELIHKLKHLEQFNNSDVPEWIWGAIGGSR